MSFAPDEAWLIPFLKRIRDRPGMYLGDEQVRTLHAFLQGYAQAREDLGIPPFVPQEESFLAGFEAWLKGRLMLTGDLAWATIVARVHPGEHGVRAFFVLLDEYLGQRGTSLARLDAAEWPPNGFPPRGS
jgi:hypothetical protein